MQLRWYVLIGKNGEKIKKLQYRDGCEDIEGYMIYEDWTDVPTETFRDPNNN